MTSPHFAGVDLGAGGIGYSTSRSGIETTGATAAGAVKAVKAVILDYP
jgi:hypothetical protein